MLKAAVLAILRRTFLLTPGARTRNRLRARMLRIRAHLPAELWVEPGETVVQVGTPHPRTVERMLRAVGHAGRVVVIEAVPGNIAALEEAMARRTTDKPRLLLINKAANSSTGAVTMQLSSTHPGDSVIAELETRMDNSDRVGADFSASQVVPGDTLDNILASVGVGSPDVILITVNGAEYRVLQGATRVLGTMGMDARIFAKAHARTPDGGTIRTDIVRLLDAQGFETSPTRRSRSVSTDPNWRFREGDVFAYRDRD